MDSREEIAVTGRLADGDTVCNGPPLRNKDIVISETLRDEAEDTEIALGEAMAFIVLAGKQAPKWKGRVVLLATDNLVFTLWLPNGTRERFPDWK